MQVRGQELFTCVRTEGALLPSQLLQRVADGDRTLPGLMPQDYHLVGNETLGEAVSRAWSRLVGAWAAFRSALETIGVDDAATSVTRERWILVLLSELGYGRLQTTAAIDVDGRSYPVSHGWQSAPLHLVGARVDLDRRTAGVAGAARQSPHSLVQELLNADGTRLWGMVSNGLRLRVLRDNAKLTRQAYVEFDLEAIMDGEVYSDFALLWLLCHQSRVEGERPEDCWLERWSREAAERGARARDALRDGVEQAIGTLGTGLLRHPESSDLRIGLREGRLAPEHYYRQLLRLVYRLLFLFVAEDRDALLSPEVSPEARARYVEHYSTARLRRLAGNRRGGRHPDLWRALRVVMRRLGADDGAPGIGLPALGSALWDERWIADVMGAEISNGDLLQAMRDLAFVTDNDALRPVDYRNLGAEELGSVYESLLELRPELNVDARTLRLIAAPGSERKTTGSFYTPTSLIVELLDSALDPVLEVATASEDPEAALLDLSICDPACGSGHFLIAAAQRVGARLASVRTGDAEPSPSAVRTALRHVVGSCIYGVDVNEMAVELCKVALWMEALEPGRPLSFLDHRIVVGNSLLGATPALVMQGVPDAAFTALLGDDRATVSSLRRRNAKERGGQATMILHGLVVDTSPLAREVAVLEAVPDVTIGGVHERERLSNALIASDVHERARWAADAWCAAFVCPKGSGEPEVTTETVRLFARDPHAVPDSLRRLVRTAAATHGFFHWHVAFPEVFSVHSNAVEDGPGWTGGFDVVLGNPPWEQTELQEKQWFAVPRPDIAAAANAAARKRMIQRLQDGELDETRLYQRWQDALRAVEERGHLLRRSGRFPLCGRGRINTYSVFAEAMQSIVSEGGRVGCVVPAGIATDDTTKHFFGHLMRTGSLISLFGFENEALLFPGIHHATKFALLTSCNRERRDTSADFVFFARQTSWLRDPERRVHLSADDLALLNPNTLTCPTFRTRRDSEIGRKIYQRVPVLLRHGPPSGNPWGLAFRQGVFNMASDSALFSTARTTGALALYEAKMVHHFDHRFGTYEGQTRAQGNQGTLPRLGESAHADADVVVEPRYWVPAEKVAERLSDRWGQGWLLGWRDICRSTDERTAIVALLPRAGAGGLHLAFVEKQHIELVACLVSCLSSFVFDWCARLKVGGTHLAFFVMEQLPAIPPRQYEEACPWDAGRLASWITPRVVELAFTARDLTAFATDVGWGGEPFQWNGGRRFLLRTELDAANFHLFGVTRNDVEHIMESFPVVRRNDEQIHGEYRTMRAILQVYDAMEVATRTGQPYETLLDPPPAHDSLRHPPRREAA